MTAKKRTLSDVPHEILAAAQKAGFEQEEKERSGSFLQLDDDVVVSSVNDAFAGKAEMLDIRVALDKYDWLTDYYGRLVPEDKDEYTKRAEEKPGGGYFIRILPGADLDFPLQSCLMISADEGEQRVHNIIIAEEGSDARIISGCALHEGVQKSLHIGVSEFFVKKNANLNFTMVHNWAPESRVRPRTVTVVDDHATFTSNYVCLNPLKDIQMYPAAVCRGRESVANLASILYASKKSVLDVGGKAVLEGAGSRAEIVSRAIARDDATIIARGLLEGKNSPVKAHLECRGLLLSDGAVIHAIPELVADHKDVDMSHEAAVGRIADKEIHYLMSRGLSRDAATSTIVRGFMDVDIMGLPAHLKDEVADIVDTMAEGL